MSLGLRCGRKVVYSSGWFLLRACTKQPPCLGGVPSDPASPPFHARPFPPSPHPSKASPAPLAPDRACEGQLAPSRKHKPSFLLHAEHLKLICRPFVQLICRCWLKPSDTCPRYGGTAQWGAVGCCVRCLLASPGSVR